MKHVILATLSATTLGLTIAAGATALEPTGQLTILQKSTTTEATVIAQATTGQFVTVDQAKASVPEIIEEIARPLKRTAVVDDAGQRGAAEIDAVVGAFAGNDALSMAFSPHAVMGDTDLQRRVHRVWRGPQHPGLRC